jgi:hypothetical protein
MGALDHLREKLNTLSDENRLPCRWCVMNQTSADQHAGTTRSRRRFRQSIWRRNAPDCEKTMPLSLNIDVHELAAEIKLRAEVLIYLMAWPAEPSH